mmetsp:Transcript_6962/g.29423  ORF Transcript_6962/g.29423 Transcript_6962/m.29423 type:complete len:668 (+) Transcript_6962:319-2322(+)
MCGRARRSTPAPWSGSSSRPTRCVDQAGHRQRPALVDDPLRVGNFDPQRPQRAQDGQVHVGAHATTAVLRVLDPEMDGQLDTIGLELAELRDRPGLAQHPRHLAHGRRQRAHDRLHVAVVGNLHRRRQQHAGVGQRRVLDALRDQQLVGHDGFLAGERADHGVARLDVADAPLEAVHLDHVADAQRALGQDYEAAHIVGRQLLQAEAQAHAQRAAQHAQRRQVDAGGRQREQQADEQQHRAHRVGRDLAHRQVQRLAAQQLRLDGRRNPQRQHQHQHRRQAALDHVAQRQVDAADLPADVVQLIHHHRPQPGDPQHRAEPDQPRAQALHALDDGRFRPGRRQHPGHQPDGRQRHQQGQHQPEQRRAQAEDRQQPPRRQREANGQQRQQRPVDQAPAEQHAERSVLARPREHGADQAGQQQAGQQQHPLAQRGRAEGTAQQGLQFIQAQRLVHGNSEIGKRAQMNPDAARQGMQVVAPLEHRDDAAPRMALGHRLELEGDPLVVGLDQPELAEVIVAVGVKAGRHEDHLGLETLQSRQPHGLDHLAHLAAAGVGRDRHIDHIGALGHRAAVGVERILEQADHQHPVVAGDDVLGAIAVVDIEVHDGHALQAAHVQRMPCRDCHVVEEAKPHALVARGMVARRAHGAEGVVGPAIDDHVGRAHGGAGCG